MTAIEYSTEPRRYLKQSRLSLRESNVTFAERKTTETTNTHEKKISMLVASLSRVIPLAFLFQPQLQQLRAAGFQLACQRLRPT